MDNLRVYFFSICCGLNQLAPHQKNTKRGTKEHAVDFEAADKQFMLIRKRKVRYPQHFTLGPCILALFRAHWEGEQPPKTTIRGIWTAVALFSPSRQKFFPVTNATKYKSSKFRVLVILVLWLKISRLISFRVKLPLVAGMQFCFCFCRAQFIINLCQI